MPPVLSRKRMQSDSPDPQPQSKRRNAPARRSRETVFQTLDAPPRAKRTLSQTKALLEQNDDESELSEPESSEDEFEDVPLRVSAKSKGKARGDRDSSESQAEDWEDAMSAQHQTTQHHGPAPVISGDIALTLSAAPKTAFETKPDGRKGPSKTQRHIRNITHCMHVQCLMFHNLMRNAWIQDTEVQKTLVKALPSSCWREIDQYWRDAGIPNGSSRAVTTRRVVTSSPATNTKGKQGKWKESDQKGVKTFEGTATKPSVVQRDASRLPKSKENVSRRGDRNARDWGATSEPLDSGTPNLSAGGPLMRLLRYLSAYWKSKFRVTAPTLRKRGYLSPTTLEAEINAWRSSPSQNELFGEKINSVESFREVATTCQGSRDVGQQLFTALLRGLGIEARMIVSLQPVGFGFSQAEEGKPRNLNKLNVEPSSSAKPHHGHGKTPQRAATRDHSIVMNSKSSDDSDLSSVITISSDTDEEKVVKRLPKARNYNEELPYPTYWTEAISHLTHTTVSASPLPRGLIAGASSSDKLQDFYARGAAADKAKQVFSYIIAFSSDGTAKDVTTRYLPKHQWPGRTKGFRMSVERMPIYNKYGKVRRWEEFDWFKSVLRSYARPHNRRQPWDEVEDEGDLVPMEPERKKTMDEEGGKETLQGYKNSAEYVLERHLRREEALRPGSKIVRHFVTGKGDKETSEPVYRRKDIVTCKTVESWHKEGREIKEGEQPLKFVPMRAVTVTRKREIEERERDEGVKPKQGLYSRSQTVWIIPPPIVDGKIPRNAFNNIDVYVPTMVPKGAVHIPLKGTARICRKLNIEHAEACTGFEFGKQRAVPVLTGVVVAAENENKVIDAWAIEEAAKAKKEADKRERLVLTLWKKFLSGLRIVERMKLEYGEDAELPAKENASATKGNTKEERSEWEVFNNHTDFEGGFLRDDGDAQPRSLPRNMSPPDISDDNMAGGLFAASQEEPVHGDLTIDHGDKEVGSLAPVAETAYQTPISLTSALQQSDNEISDHGDGEKSLTLDEPEDNDEDHGPRPALQKGSIGSRRRRTHAKATPAVSRNRKSITANTSDKEDDTLLSDTSVDLATPPRSTRSVPKRKAASRSDAQIKSHFFAQGSDGETDLTDLTDRTSPTKNGAKARGRVKGRLKRRGVGREKLKR